MDQSITLLSTSFAVGLLIGLTGMGGAALMTPFLILVVHVRPTLAVGTDLMYAALTKWTGAWVHWRQGTVDTRLALRLAVGSVPGGILGVLGIAYLKSRHVLIADEFVRRGMGLMLATVAVIMILRAIFDRQLAGNRWLQSERTQRIATIAWGAFVGVAVGFTSVGSGSLLMPFLALLYPLPAARMVGTDIFHAAILMTATAALHWGAGNIEWTLVPWLVVGSVPGVLIGSMLAPRLPQRALKLGLGVTLLATSARLIP
jgi:uncharacterized protein